LLWHTESYYATLGHTQSSYYVTLCHVKTLCVGCEQYPIILPPTFKVNKSLYQNGEQNEGQNGLPDFHFIRRDPLEDDEEPDVGEDGEESRHNEHDDLICEIKTKVLHFLD